MSADLNFVAAGMTAEVRKARPAGIGQAGIAVAAVRCPVHGEPLLALTIVHPDGEALSVFLGEVMIDRLAEQMAMFVEALPAVQSAARH